MKPRRAALMFLAALLLETCTSRVAPYDAALERDLGELQSSMSGFFEQLQKAAGTPAAEWQSHEAFYDRTEERIAALQSRAALQVRNDQTIRSLDLLLETLGEVESMHRAGLTAGEIPVVRELVGAQLRMLLKLEAAKKRPWAGEVSP